jgi:GTP cyclohydrolase II
MPAVASGADNPIFLPGPDLRATIMQAADILAPMKALNGKAPAISTPINGDPAALDVDRCSSELRRGRCVEIRDGDRSLVFATLETAQPPLIERLAALAHPVWLILTPERAAAALARPIEGPVRIALRNADMLEALRICAGMTGLGGRIAPELELEAWDGSDTLAAAGFRLAKFARLVPALVGFECPALDDDTVQRVRAADIARHAGAIGAALRRTSSSHVPLADAEDSTIALFREEHGSGEHVAVIIGSPDLTGSVPVRLHSACLTGDVLGSLRCDCGEQLRTAVRRIAELGGGVLLYLDQEGRGIGLANKLRAYSIQDTGLDTLDADLHLGFRADERSYDVAAALLRELGISSVELLTNNPQKIAALREHGIDVVGRLPLVTATTAHNERYLRAKRERAGHLSDDAAG